MNDRELLELAAKAAGYEVDYFEGDDFDNPHLLVDNGAFMLGSEFWDPLTDDGDALRLAVSLPGMSLEWVIASAWQAHDGQEDRQAYVRRTIVERAAQLGGLLP